MPRIGPAAHPPEPPFLTREPSNRAISVDAYYYAEDRLVQESLKNGRLIGFIPKPFMLDEVRQMAKSGVEISRQRREVC